MIAKCWVFVLTKTGQWFWFMLTSKSLGLDQPVMYKFTLHILLGGIGIVENLQ